MSLTINALPVSSMRFVAPWSGVWTADVELMSDTPVAPSGRVVIASTDGIALSGTVDDAHSAGTFGEKKHVRVLGGGAGWRKDVRAQHFHSDVGLPLQVLATTTAAEVLEVVTVLVPQVVGVDYVRRAGPASQIFTDAGVDWWVGFDGVTRVGLRLPGLQPKSLVVKDWNPDAGTLSFHADTLPEPGAVLVDTRFGTRTVRAVEATVSGGSVTGTLWVAASAATAGSVDELVDSLAILAREASRAEFGRFYEFRVIAMAGDRVELQAVKRADGIPDILPASIWAGASGYRATLTPGSQVLVGFRGGDPRRPFVAFYEPPEGEGWRPLALELDALGLITMGGLGALPVARAPSVATFAIAVAAAVNALGGALNALGPAPVLSAELGALVQGAGAAIAAAATTLAADCPSKKVLAA